MKKVTIFWDDDNKFRFEYSGVDRPSQVLTMTQKCMTDVRRLILQGKGLETKTIIEEGESVCHKRIQKK